ncbi:chaperone protein PapD [Pseudomonas syringae pv. coriandricola]|uniref:Chaperone protein PapD n=2 Tax=Pseudomonas syringae group genomosp. 3 TaxID=251701 RepID=A0A3M5RSD0_9PSED|nr:chaperone protein PapD [Pseudomonas syringae pv. philadelphi]RMM29992.1 Chaperone protein PapD [Pseudomonas syringae pv. berberidis]RMQ27861.1 Chaperone protein PapD [Pseudomonas syringae pv. berberidis]RMR35299.1 Chaperone protein PapD [Pseudomonas syringae pv. coriandricola]RMU11826.1 chaperone protein PapD [Pseudomonas syringae pv. coriandricola]
MSQAAPLSTHPGPFTGLDVQGKTTMIGTICQQAVAKSALGLGMALAVLSIHIPVAEAALTVNATRVVFASEKRSTSVVISNPSDRPFAVQTWVNTTVDDTVTAVPFAPSPPLFRLNPGKQQQVQINGLPNDLPADRESLFFFNVQEIPQADSSQGNVLNIALRTRLKLFYRPAGLTDNPIARLKDLQWSIEQSNGKTRLVGINPTPFHVSFIRLEVTANGKTEKIAQAAMLAPFASQAYELGETKAEPGVQVVFSAINDYGGYSVPLTVPVTLAH